MRRFDARPIRFEAVSTNLKTGEADYHEVRDYHDDLPYLIASSSMPLVSQIIEADGKLLLDGGTSDSVPLLHSMLTGASKHIVVLTQAAGYKKKPNKLMALMRQRYADYPYYLDRLQYRHYEYNRLYRWIEREQAAGRIFVIRPPEPVTVSSMEHDTDKLLALYEQGLAAAAQAWPKLPRSILRASNTSGSQPASPLCADAPPAHRSHVSPNRSSPVPHQRSARKHPRPPQQKRFPCPPISYRCSPPHLSPRQPPSSPSLFHADSFPKP